MKGGNKMVRVGGDYMFYPENRRKRNALKVLWVAAFSLLLYYSFSKKDNIYDQSTINSNIEYVTPFIRKADTLIDMKEYATALDLIDSSRSYLHSERNKLLRDNSPGFINTERIDSTLKELKGLEARIEDSN